jgi:peptidoglycan-associated lipoprotein
MKNAFTVRLICASLIVGAACSHAPEPAPVPAPTMASNTDNSAANAARDRTAAMRRDSISRADAARRDASARADADRRAREAAAQRVADAARDALAAKVYFDFDKDALLPDDIASLDAKTPILMSHPAVRIRIEGNTDDRGSDEYNVALGQRRAAAAKRYLVAHGVSDARIETASNGEEHPACQEKEESCWHQNRRDEFVISAGADALASPRQ